MRYSKFVLIQLRRIGVAHSLYSEGRALFYENTGAIGRKDQWRHVELTI